MAVSRVLSVIVAVLLSTAWSCPQLGISGDYSYDPSSGIGPDKWGSVSGYETCRTGSAQSPVDVVTVGSSAMLTKPSASYGAAIMSLKKKVENWALECSLPNTCGSISYNDETFNVFNIHFHSPSEHTIDGNRYPLEAHVVHLKGGKIRVMAFLFDIGGASNTVASLVIANICLGLETITVPLDALLSEPNGMCTYSGSLTTPPCSEGVEFFVHRNILTITQADLDLFIQTFNSPVNANSRPIQGIKNRSMKCSA